MVNGMEGGKDERSESASRNGMVKERKEVERSETDRLKEKMSDRRERMVLKRRKSEIEPSEAKVISSDNYIL